MNDPKIIIALDYDNQSDVMQLVQQIDPSECRLKIGKELFTACGPDIVRKVQDLGFEVFLDLKFHDIPATVAKACKAAANLGVWMLNVHALGGVEMLKAARNAVDDSGKSTHLIAVTLLTSHSQSDISQVGLGGSIAENVLKLADLSFQSKLDGVVCSAQETEILRQHLGNDFLLITPGIRPAGSCADDQTRIVTPHDALKNGSSYLVIGRPITLADNPLAALREINQSIN